MEKSNMQNNIYKMVKIYGREFGIYNEVSKETYGEYDINSGCVYIKDYHELFQYFGELYITNDGYLGYLNYYMCYGDIKSPEPLTWKNVKQFKIIDEHYKYTPAAKLSEDGLSIIRGNEVVYSCPDWFKPTLNLCDYMYYDMIDNIRCEKNIEELLDKCSLVKRIIVNNPSQLSTVEQIAEYSKHPERICIVLKEPFEKYPKEKYEMAWNRLSKKGIKILLGYINKTGKIQSDISLNYELNESFSFNIFRDCRTFQEKKDRLIDLIKSGMITAGFAMAIISTMTPNKAAQEEIMQEVIEVSTNAEKGSQNANIEAVPKFNENVVFATDWKISNDGIKHIKRYEKFSATPYYATQKDKQNDIKTIGYGHVIKDSDPDWLKTAKSITEEEASILFEKDIDSFGRLFKYEIAPTLNRGLRVPEAFPQVMMDAMLSMMYNSGNGNFKKDSINPFYARLKNCRLDKESGKIDKRDYDYTIASIPNSLIYHRGEVMKGLQNRRQTEYKMAAQAK